MLSIAICDLAVGLVVVKEWWIPTPGMLVLIVGLFLIWLYKGATLR